MHEEIIPTLPLDKKDLEEFASAVEDRFNNPFVNHELMSISLNSTSKWKARNMPSFLAYIEEQKQLPKCLTMSLAAYIAFYSSDIQERTADGLICKRPAGNTYKIQDDAWAWTSLSTDTRPAGARCADQHPDVGSGSDQDRGSGGRCSG